MVSTAKACKSVTAHMEYGIPSPGGNWAFAEADDWDGLYLNRASMLQMSVGNSKLSGTA
jgi:hypothetical protein